MAKDRLRHKLIHNESKNGGFFEKLRAAHDAYSGWFCVLLIGIGSGIVAGVVDIGSQWTVNLKNGVCKDAFWLNREQCCWSSNISYYDKFENVHCDKVILGSYIPYLYDIHILRIRMRSICILYRCR